MRAICHHPETGWSEIRDLSMISNKLGEAGTLLWAFADVSTLSANDVALIAEEFSLHPLAVEDATNLRQRPKLEAYDKHLFAVVHQLDEIEGQLEARQIACFIGANFVLTMHDRSERTMRDALARAQASVRALDQGPSLVMHALLDTVVDDYQKIADDLEQDIEEIEDVVLSDPAAGLQHRVYSLRQALSRLRRYITPGERVLAAVLDPKTGPVINERTAAHFRDVHDHARRIIEQTQNIQSLVDAVTDLQRSAHAIALNEVTKRLTGWAAIIAVPTLIASIYGMNFELVPEGGERSGFFFAIGLMFATGAGLYVYFKKRGWI